MTPSDVLDVLGWLACPGVSAKISGGWGVDALVGRATRDHRDLDVSVPADRLSEACTALADHGFVVTTDWLPVRVELSDSTRHVDIHPLNYRADGSAWQAGLDDTRFEYPPDAWTSGRIDGVSVTCLTVEMQRRFHSGYPPRPVDLHDLALLDTLLTR
ncbi:MAG: lincomycin resistance protein LmrB [Propionibacteriaceae bacterium]